MDKYEYKVRAGEIKTLIAQGEYIQAAEIADTIDWRRVKSVMMLCTISDLYKINRRYEDARDMLLLAYDRHPGGRTIVYSLCELSIKMEEFVQAVEYYKEFVQIAPKDTGRYILQYKLYEAQDVGLEERIEVLEELKKRDYREKWAYELAYLYHRRGLAVQCVDECDELILWFGEGKYVIKAMELKMLHQPLTPQQQMKYNNRFAENEPQQYYNTAGYTPNEAYGEETVESDSYSQAGGYGIQPDYENMTGYPPLNNYGGENGYDPQYGYDNGYNTGEDYQGNTGGYVPEDIYEGMAGADVGQQDYSQVSGYGTDYPVTSDYQPGSENQRYYQVQNGYKVPGSYDEPLYYGQENGYEAGARYKTAGNYVPESGYGPDGEFAGTDGTFKNGYGAPQENVTESFYEESNYAIPEQYGEDGYDPVFTQSAGILNLDYSLTEPLEEELDFEVKTIKVGEYDTINLQKELAEGLKEVLGETESSGPTQNEAVELEFPQNKRAAFTLPGEAQIQRTEVFFGETGNLEPDETEDKAEGAAPLMNPQATEAVPTNHPRANQAVPIQNSHTTETVSEKNPRATQAVPNKNPQATQTVPKQNPHATETVPEKNPRATQAVPNKNPQATQAVPNKNPQAIQAVPNKNPQATQTVPKQNPQATEAVPEKIPQSRKPASEMPRQDYGTAIRQPRTFLSPESSEPPKELANVLAMESDGQISLVVPEADRIEKQITGQLSIEDILAEWERMKKDNEERHKEEFREMIIRHTGPMFTEFEAAVRDGLLEQLEVQDSYSSSPEPEEEAESEELQLEEELILYEEDSSQDETFIFETSEEEENETVIGFREGQTVRDESVETEMEYSYEEPDEEYETYHTEEFSLDTEYEVLDYEQAFQEESDEAFEEKELGETQEPYEALTDFNQEQELLERKNGGEKSRNVEETDEIDYEPIKLPDEEPQATPQKVQEDPVKPQNNSASQEQKTLAGKGKERGQAKRSLTKEEKELFGPYIQNKTSKERLLTALENIRTEACTGNIIVTGEEGMDTMTMAKNLIREVQLKEPEFSGKIARISGSALNEKDPLTIVNQLEKGALIIQKASGINKETAKELNRGLHQEALQIVVVLEDMKKAMNKFLAKYPDLAECFTARMDLEALSNEALAAFGRKYAREREYSIDELGILALHTRIEDLQTSDHVVTVMDVKAIIDEAIRHASKKSLGHFMDILLAKRYDEEDMIILRENDFIETRR